MERVPNTTISGKPFSASVIDAVWNKAKDKNGYTILKIDHCGAVIMKEDYGKHTVFGWEIDHIIPVALGGTDDIDNLQALHWENNRYKADKYPEWECLRHY